MNRAEFTEIFNATHTERSKLMLGKAEDYANTDVLANFKRMSDLCEILQINPGKTPTDCALFLMLLKIDRWCNLRNKGTSPQNESVKDTVNDLHNYIDLAYACEVDK